MPIEHINKTDTLNEGREKLNAAIDGANVADVTSKEADTKATQALANSESTQTQLDTIVIDGDSSVEAAQARVDEKGVPHPTLKARIDDGMNSVNQQLAETGINITNYSHLVFDGNWIFALVQAIIDANGNRVIIPSGTYLVDNVEEDLKTFRYILDGIPIHLEGIGEVRLKANREFIPRHSTQGVTDFKATRNILNIINSEKVVMSNITFDGGLEDGESSNSSLADVHYDYQMSMVEIRNSVVEWDNVYFTRNLSVYPIQSMGGLENPDLVEHQNHGVNFFRNCRRVSLGGGGILEPSSIEGYEIMESKDVRVDKFYSDSKGTWTPLNIWGNGTVATISDSVFKNSDGSAIGLGGENSDLSVLNCKFIGSGGVNLTRQVGVNSNDPNAPGVETKGFKNALISNNTFTDTHTSSHGFMCKVGGRVEREWINENWEYGYDNLTLSNNTMNGGLVGAIIQDVRNVTLDNNTYNDVVYADTDGHNGVKGIAMSITRVEHLSINGAIVDGSKLKDTFKPKKAIDLSNCTHVSMKGLTINGTLFTEDGIEVRVSQGEKGQYFRSLEMDNIKLIATQMRIGTPERKIGNMFRGNITYYNKDHEMILPTPFDTSLNVENMLPLSPIIVMKSNQEVVNGQQVKIDFDNVVKGKQSDISNGDFITKQRGFYQFNVSVRMGASIPNSRVRMWIFKNGSYINTSIPLVEHVTGDLGTNNHSFTASVIAEGGYDDLFSVRLRHDSGEPVNVDMVIMEVNYLSNF